MEIISLCNEISTKHTFKVYFLKHSRYFYLAAKLFGLQFCISILHVILFQKSEGLQIKALRNLLGLICSTYQGKKPDACKK